MRDSFVLYTKIDEVLASLTNEQKGILFQIIVDYEKTGELPKIDDPIVKIAFIPIRQDLDANNKKWEDEVKARKEAGRKGGLAKASNAKNDVAKASNAKNDVANVADNEYVNDNDNENENVNEKDNIPPISPTGDVSKGREKNQQAEDLFNSLWKLYPKKKGKGKVSLTQKKKLLTIGYEELSRCIDRFIKDHANTEEQYLPHGSTFFNSGYVDYLDENFDKPLEKPPDTQDDDEEMTDEEWLEYMRNLDESEN